MKKIYKTFIIFMTIMLYVSDAVYNNSESTTLEVRAKGGSSSSSGSTFSVLDNVEVVVDDAVVQTTTTTTAAPNAVARFFQSIGDWFASWFN